VARHFIGSQEFQDTYGTPATVSNRDFITLLYANVLDRTPDDGGFAAWNTNMQNGMSREQVLVHFQRARKTRKTSQPRFLTGFGIIRRILFRRRSDGCIAALLVAAREKAEGDDPFTSLALW
jgi:hypothetical protein